MRRLAPAWPAVVRIQSGCKSLATANENRKSRHRNQAKIQNCTKQFKNILHSMIREAYIVVWLANGNSTCMRRTGLAYFLGFARSLNSLPSPPAPLLP